MGIAELRVVVSWLDHGDQVFFSLVILIIPSFVDLTKYSVMVVSHTTWDYDDYKLIIAVTFRKMEDIIDGTIRKNRNFTSIG